MKAPLYVGTPTERPPATYFTQGAGVIFAGICNESAPVS